MVTNDIAQAVQKKAPYCTSMLTRWIHQAMLGNTHMVIKLSHCRFTFTSNEKMKFSAHAIVSTGPDFNNRIETSFVWTKKGDHLKGNFKII